ncbi:MAG: class I SAM-dependent methyltransferase [bacterium]
MIKKLTAKQTATFDAEYVNATRWRIVRDFIDHDFPKGNFCFLDIGGGNGIFTDRVLREYPGCEGTILDNSLYLLERNKKHERKRIIYESIENLGTSVTSKFDIIFINWVLHHLVADTYRESINHIWRTLRSCSERLTSQGKISIFENLYDGYVIDCLPGLLVYTLTSTKALVPFTSKLGANTAGVGVCFLSFKRWVKIIRKAGYHIERFNIGKQWKLPIHHKLALHLRQIRIGHFWCASEPALSKQPSNKKVHLFKTRLV